MTKQFDGILTTLKDEYDRLHLIIDEDNDIMMWHGKIITELEKHLTDTKEVILAALNREKLVPQPQDITRLTFTFDEFQRLRKALCFSSKQKGDP